MKKIIKIFMLCILMLTLTGCLSKEQKKIIKQYEEMATKIMKNYLSENYPGSKILDVGQMTSFNTGSGWDISEYTEFIVEYQTEKYTFYYDKDREIFYSDVNYNKVKEEIKTYITENYSFNTGFLSDFSIGIITKKIRSGGVEVIRDSDKSLNDFINSNDINKEDYYISLNFKYNNLVNFSVKDFFDEKLFIKFHNLGINIENFVNNGCYDRVSMTSYMYNDDISVGISYVHKKSITLSDEIKINYDDRYIDLQIHKTDDYEENPIRKSFLDREFIPINLAYAWKAEIIKPFPEHKRYYYTENGLKVTYSESENDILYMLFPEKKFNNVFFKSIRTDQFSPITCSSGSDICKLHWYLNSEYYEKNEDVISFYKEKVKKQN